MPRNYTSTSLEERWLRHVTKTETCWLAPAKPGKYGIFSASNPRRSILAHRFAWELASGETIPAGREVNHTCDVRNCVRNDEPGTYVVNGIALPRFGHLFLGSPKINMIDRSDKGRSGARFGETHPHRKLTADLVREIRQRYAAGGITMQALADEYGMTYLPIHDAIRRKAWKHVI